MIAIPKFENNTSDKKCQKDFKRVVTSESPLSEQNSCRVQVVGSSKHSFLMYLMRRVTWRKSGGSFYASNVQISVSTQARGQSCVYIKTQEDINNE